MTVEDDVGKDSRRDAVTDPEDGLDAVRLPRIARLSQLEVELLVRDALRDEDERVRRYLDVLPEIGLRRRAPLVKRVDRQAAAQRDALVVEAPAQQRPFESLVAERRDLGERAHELHAEAVVRELLGDPGAHEVAL